LNTSQRGPRRYRCPAVAQHSRVLRRVGIGQTSARRAEWVHLVDASPDPASAGAFIELRDDRDGKDGQQQREAHRGEHRWLPSGSSSVRMRIAQTALEVQPRVPKVSPGEIDR